MSSPSSATLRHSKNKQASKRQSSNNFHNTDSNDGVRCTKQTRYTTSLPSLQADTNRSSNGRTLSTSATAAAATAATASSSSCRSDNHQSTRFGNCESRDYISSYPQPPPAGSPNGKLPAKSLQKKKEQQPSFQRSPAAAKRDGSDTDDSASYKGSPDLLADTPTPDKSSNPTDVGKKDLEGSSKALGFNDDEVVEVDDEKKKSSTITSPPPPQLSSQPHPQPAITASEQTKASKKVQASLSTFFKAGPSSSEVAPKPTTSTSTKSSVSKSSISVLSSKPAKKKKKADRDAITNPELNTNLSSETISSVANSSTNITMNQAEENNLQLSIDKVNLARDRTKARETALSNEGKSTKLGNGQLESKYKQLKIADMTEVIKMIKLLQKSPSVVGDKTASDKADLLLLGMQKLRNFVTNFTEVPSTTMQVYDTPSMFNDVNRFEGFSKKVRKNRKEGYITALNKNLLEEASSFVDTMLPNSTTGESFKVLFGANVESIEAAKVQKNAAQRKKRKEGVFMFGYTRNEWNKMVLDYNNGDVVHHYNNNSTKPVTKKMKYNANKTALEYIDP